VKNLKQRKKTDYYVVEREREREGGREKKENRERERSEIEILKEDLTDS
jgi:hypothetical protein